SQRYFANFPPLLRSQLLYYCYATRSYLPCRPLLACPYSHSSSRLTTAGLTAKSGRTGATPPEMVKDKHKAFEAHKSRKIQGVICPLRPLAKHKPAQNSLVLLR
ncbi:MAG: hypothetical protein M3Y54_10795, partial [Bacteroidota bacterium]|nr:hypothetical protein [Bacteroidota bacterium]